MSKLFTKIENGGNALKVTGSGRSTCAHLACRIATTATSGESAPALVELSVSPRATLELETSTVETSAAAPKNPPILAVLKCSAGCREGRHVVNAVGGAGLAVQWISHSCWTADRGPATSA